MRTCLICKRVYDDEVSFCEADGAQTASIMPGSRLLDGKYEIDRLLGQGGMGAVFVATQHGIERQVAVKLINPSFVSNAQALERFKREALATGRVKHPNAITVYDFGVTAEGVAYLAMEYLAGTSLREELAKVRVMEPSRVIEILGPVCSAIESAHRQNIVHRDLKPDNIFLESLDDGAVAPKVLDFGIAKLRSAQAGAPDLTGEGSSIGTPAYMSPEQAKGLHLDARSDVYALGVIAYEMLSGALPFQSTSPMGYLVQHMMEAPIPLSAANPRIASQIEGVVMQALGKAPEARPQSALEFGRALAAALEASKAPKPSSAAGLQEAVSFLHTLTAEAANATRGLATGPGKLLGWAVGMAMGVRPDVASEAFAELARELVAAAAQRIPYESVLQGASRWAERRLGIQGLVAPTAIQQTIGVSLRSAGIALYCAQPGLQWSARMPSGSELPLRFSTLGDGEPFAETVPDVSSYFVGDLPGGQVVALIARSKGKVVWSESVALVDGGTTLVLCVPEPDVTATQNPEMFAHLFGTVEIHCSEPGAEIFVDQGPVPWGVTIDGGPVLLYCVIPGRHRVNIRKEYFNPVGEDVEIEAGSRAVVRAALVRSQARAEVVANLAGVLVEFTGPEPARDIATVTTGEPWSSRPIALPAGRYRVRSSSVGCAPFIDEISLRGDTARRIEIVFQPQQCPLCGQPAGVDTFTCPGCNREHVHSFHRFDQGVCIDCAAKASFDRAKTAGTVDAWRTFLEGFRSANVHLTRQAELEMRFVQDKAREAELAERAERFAALAARGQMNDVVASWTRVVNERPGDHEARLALAMALEAVGDRGGALASMRIAAERAPKDPFVRRELGRLHVVLRNHGEAVREYTAAVQLKPNFADAHFELASLLAASGQVDSAIEGFRAAAASQPQNAVYHEGHGRALADRGRYREAGEAFRRAANCYRSSGNLERATINEQRSQEAFSQTAIHKAGRMIKGLLE